MSVTDDIKELQMSSRANKLAVAYKLAQAAKTTSFWPRYNTVEEYGISELGYSYSMIHSMVRVGRELLRVDTEGNVCSVIKPDAVTDYTVSQLQELLTLDRKDLISLARAGAIRPEMTVREIRTIVRNFKGGVIDAQGRTVPESIRRKRELAAMSQAATDAMDHIRDRLDTINDDYSNIFDDEMIQGLKQVKTIINKIVCKIRLDATLGS